MPPGKSWLSYIPGYDVLQAKAESMHGVMGGHVVVQHLVALLFVSLVIAIIAIKAKSELSAAGDDVLPDDKWSARTVVELVMKFILYIMQFAMPYKTAIKHFPIVGTLGFLILFSNLLGLVPGFLPPTENFNVTIACGSIIFVYYNGYALWKLGLGHIAHMANPVGEPWGWFLAPLFLPIELISHTVRPISLAVRLLCNIAGDHMVLAVFVGILPLPLLYPVPILGLGLFVSILQAFVFLLLSSVYIGEVEANIEHHAHAHAHDHAHSHAAGAAAPAH